MAAGRRAACARARWRRRYARASARRLRWRIDRIAADASHVDALFDAALEGFCDGWTLNGSAERRWRGNLNLRRDGLDVARLMADLRDIAFSAGSACASGSGRPSHVLQAIGLSDVEARSSIRLGFGRYTTVDEIETAVAAIRETADRQRAFAA